MNATIKKKSLQISRTGHYRICIGVFRLCTGNDRLDVLPIGDLGPGICGILCCWTWLHSLDDHGGTVQPRTAAECNGHSCVSQLDGELCGRHRFSKFTGIHFNIHNQFNDNVNSNSPIFSFRFL